ncbi:uncharacterized protein [Macrobrachium rosenbergii]
MEKLLMKGSSSAGGRRGGGDKKEDDDDDDKRPKRPFKDLMKFKTKKHNAGDDDDDDDDDDDMLHYMDMMRRRRRRGDDDYDDMMHYYYMDMMRRGRKRRPRDRRDDRDMFYYEYMRHWGRRYPFDRYERGSDSEEDEDEDEEEPVGKDGFRYTFVKPQEWQPPEKVDPVEKPLSDRESSDQHSTLTTDAMLYTLHKRDQDGMIVSHTILKMPSSHPGGQTLSRSNHFNILMADVSGSMSYLWSTIKKHWNTYVSPRLEGTTRIFTFGNRVDFRREGTTLRGRDFSGGSTELTGALQTILSQIYTCSQKFVNVFIITDGDHNCSQVTPSTIINQMDAQNSKVCNVFLLGIGNSFPVKYSIGIRSRLHTGSSNLPTIYWAKEKDDIRDQMQAIGNKLCDSTYFPIKLNTLGCQLPGLVPKDTFYLGEFVYFPDEPRNHKELSMTAGNHTVTTKLEPTMMDVETLLRIFRQWNTNIIQMKFKEESVSDNMILLMENLYGTLTEKPKSAAGKSIRERISAEEKGRDMEFRTFINKVKEILTREKFENQIELAENILSTSVTRSKYEVKTLQLKGHTDKEFEKDCKEFLKIYDTHKEAFLRLEIPPEYLCQATHQSTLTDLQDKDFPELLKREKFEFLKSFTISGIAVHAPTRDSVTLNPWSYRIQRIVKAPYTIMSQVSMETMDKDPKDKVNKTVHAEQNDDSTSFNAIVPVFPPHIAKHLKPIIRSKIYAMCVTFATLKNPHIIDFNIHMATLAVTWVRYLFENPTLPRSEYVKAQMESIEATAQCYMDRTGYATYVEVLKDKPELALMTESTEKINNKAIMCETMIKPMFLLNLMQLSDNKIDLHRIEKILRVILLEYIGRCLSHYKSQNGEGTPYTDYFASSLEDQERKKQFVEDFVKNAKEEISSSNTTVLVESYYTFEDVRKAAKIVAKNKLESMKEKMIATITIEVNAEKVKSLRNVTSAGDVSWNTLETYAHHMGLQEEVVNQLFSQESIFVYTAHALRYRSSKERLASNVGDFETCKNFVNDEVRKENLQILSKQLLESLPSALEDEWLKDYLDIHTEVVEPMTPQQIVHKAQQLGIAVTEETFQNVYKKYRPKLGLLGNACQTKGCPYYLQPKEHYNQHASVERLMGRTTFIHGMHKVAHQYHSHDMSTILKEISSGKHTSKKEAIPEEDVMKWETGIKKLKSIYSEQEKISSVS